MKLLWEISYDQRGAGPPCQKRGVFALKRTDTFKGHSQVLLEDLMVQEINKPARRPSTWQSSSRAQDVEACSGHLCSWPPGCPEAQECVKGPLVEWRREHAVAGLLAPPDGGGRATSLS